MYAAEVTLLFGKTSQMESGSSSETGASVSCPSMPLGRVLQVRLSFLILPPSHLRRDQVVEREVLLWLLQEVTIDTPGAGAPGVENEGIAVVSGPIDAFGRENKEILWRR